jgi:membrane protein insertase Oxa1/YidC/SpoIIIJ
MALLKPELDKLKKKYGNDKEKLAQEQFNYTGG